MMTAALALAWLQSKVRDAELGYPELSFAVLKTEDGQPEKFGMFKDGEPDEIATGDTILACIEQAHERAVFPETNAPPVEEAPSMTAAPEAAAELDAPATATVQAGQQTPQ